MEETGREVTCGAPVTPAVKGWVKVKVKVEVHIVIRSIAGYPLFWQLHFNCRDFSSVEPLL